MAGTNGKVSIDTRQILTDNRRAISYQEETRDPPQETSSRITFSRVFCCANSYLTPSKDGEMINQVDTFLYEKKENLNPQPQDIGNSYEDFLSTAPGKENHRVHESTVDRIKVLDESSGEDALTQRQSTLYNYLSDDTESVVTNDSDLSQNGFKRDIQSVPKFRTARLQKLRKRMTLNAASTFENPDQLMKSAMSYDSHKNRKKERSNFVFPDQRYLMTSNKESRVVHPFSNLLKGCDCFTDTTDTTDEKTFRAGPYKSLFENTEELAYDSDPEFFHANSEMNELQNSNNTSCIKRDLGRSTNSEEYLGHQNEKLALNNELVAARLMKEMTHGSINLIWHLPKRSSRSAPPTCVRMWLELGCRLQKQIIQPKLIWRSAYNEGCQQENGRHLLSEPECSGDIDLLDISRILILKQIDRQEFPFAIQRKSFVIVTSDKKRLLFEASSYSERQRIVSGLKLLVAKLAAMIIVGDRTIFDDFFHPSAFGEYQRQTDCVNLLTS